MDAFCFVCGRPTDHVGEHEALVALGLASYQTQDELAHVVKTAAWDDAFAAAVSEAEYQAMYASKDPAVVRLRRRYLALAEHQMNVVNAGGSDHDQQVAAHLSTQAFDRLLGTVLA